MNRKSFLSALPPLAASLITARQPRLAVDNTAQQKPILIPPYLKAGDTVGITSPAGYISREELQPAILQMQSWGLMVRIGGSIGKRDFNFGGTDAERADDFQRMLDDRSVKAIMCARGGYGAVRIIDKLNFTQFAKRPKWIIGFSDITVLHCHLNRNYGIASIHSKMCNSFPENWAKAEPVQVDTILSIRQALAGKKMAYNVMPAIKNRSGTAEGVLIGGNLKTIETLAGTKSDINTGNMILFVEDTGEYLYSIDRMFWNLKRTGKLTNLKGLIIGGFSNKIEESGQEFGRSVYDIVLEKVKPYRYPVCFDFPVGHQKNNYALKCGVKHKLEVNAVSVTLKEM